MRRFVLAVCILALTLGLVAGVATAAVDDDAVAGLKASPVYIAPGTEGTTPETASGLLQQLRAGDNIVIIMLPAGALDSYDGGIQAFLGKIDKSTGGGKRVIALAVGNQTVGYSTLLPSGVAPDLMNRAVSVSVNKTEALGTFVRNVHKWQALNPAAPASKPTTKPKQDGGNALLLTLIGTAIAVAGLAVLGLVLRNRRGQLLSEEHIRFRSPDNVKAQLQQILNLREHVNDQEMRNQLIQIARDTEEYFKRNTAKRTADAATFERHLTTIVEVLRVYIDVQNFSRYYYNPQEYLREGKASVAGFAVFVLNAVRRGTRQDLITYNVNTDILAAQKHA